MTKNDHLLLIDASITGMISSSGLSLEEIRDGLQEIKENVEVYIEAIENDIRRRGSYENSSS